MHAHHGIPLIVLALAPGLDVEAAHVDALVPRAIHGTATSKMPQMSPWRPITDVGASICQDRPVRGADDEPAIAWCAAVAHADVSEAPESMFSGPAVSVADAEGNDGDEDAATDSITRMFDTLVEFVTESSRHLETDSSTGIIVRLLIIVEVLIGALGFASCVTVWGRGKANLMFRIVEVMGALFLVIALLIVWLTVL
jgi:hypothetical protein